MQAKFIERGALARLDIADLSVLQYPASELEDGLARLVLRRRDNKGTRFVSLFGLHALATPWWTESGPELRGTWSGLDVFAAFRLARGMPGWCWHLRVRNTTGRPVVVDVLHTLDVALAPWGAVRTSEYYVSQYLDLSAVPLEGHGPAVAVRQNMPGERAPWALIGCLGVTQGWSTDALQLNRGKGWASDLPSRRLQHEHSLVGLQTAPGRSNREPSPPPDSSGWCGQTTQRPPPPTTPGTRRRSWPTRPRRHPRGRTNPPKPFRRNRSRSSPGPPTDP